MMRDEERQQFLQRALQGDREALGALLDSFRDYIRVIVYALWNRRLQARVDGSDFIQDALAEAIASFPEFNGTTMGEFVRWLRVLIVRTVLGKVRGELNTGKRDPVREQQQKDLDQLLANSSNTPSKNAIRHEEEVRVADALAKLPDDMRQVLIARHIEQLSHPEIAERMSRLPGNVRALYIRALRQMRDLLRE